MAVCQPTTTILSFFFVEVEVGVEVWGGGLLFWSGGWEIWRVKLISTQVVVEVDV